MGRFVGEGGCAVVSVCPVDRASFPSACVACKALWLFISGAVVRGYLWSVCGGACDDVFVFFSGLREGRGGRWGTVQFMLREEIL